MTTPIQPMSAAELADLRSRQPSRHEVQRLLDIAQDHARLVEENADLNEAARDCGGDDHQPYCRHYKGMKSERDALRDKLDKAKADLRVQVVLNLKHLARIKAICDDGGELPDSGDSPEMLSARALRKRVEVLEAENLIYVGCLTVLELDSNCVCDPAPAPNLRYRPCAFHQESIVKAVQQYRLGMQRRADDDDAALAAAEKETT